MKRILFTKEGYEKVKKERDELIALRQEAVENLARARELGDLSENSLYKAARARLSSIDNRIRRLSELLKIGEVVEKPTGETIGIDSIVTVTDGKKIRVFHIVGGYESDPLSGKISHNSPIGKALVGKRVGDSINVDVPAGKVSYKILKIES
ncbi:MAG: transcription elongation factor GreA [Patescibacteria group bacterium]|nr:transcription elongation factor GreA [Patescibacteria group bacterium]MCL5113873.1 transcription elongation factor GreA [Patescibacteria group bacterium]